MLERIESLESELRDVEIRLGDPAVQSDPRQLAELGRRFKQLEDVVRVARRLRQSTDDLADFREMMSAADHDERDELRGEIEALEAAVAGDEEQLRVLLLPRDPNDERNVIIEIRGAAGGEEANLFARDLFTMFESFAKRMGWHLEVLSASHSDLGGYSEITAMLSGDLVWSRMKHEAGTHRVPEFEGYDFSGSFFSFLFHLFLFHLLFFHLFFSRFFLFSRFFFFHLLFFSSFFFGCYLFRRIGSFLSVAAAGRQQKCQGQQEG